MTRKRFVKLLMSHGEPIHAARTIALRYNARSIPYKEAYSDYTLKTSFIRAITKMGDVCIKLSGAIENAAQSLKRFMEATRNDRPNS